MKRNGCCCGRGATKISSRGNTPATEVGWRFDYEQWGNGYATEGAAAALKFGFEELHLPQIVAMTAVRNVRSRRVMHRLGMQRDVDGDFDHPRIEAGHPLARHVLYRITPLGRTL